MSRPRLCVAGLRVRVGDFTLDADLALPAGTPVDLDAETFSGDLESRFESDVEQFSDEGMTVRLGDASVRVRAQTFSGEFRLRESDG